MKKEEDKNVIPEICKRLGIVEFSHCWMLQTDVEFRKELYQFIVPLRSAYDSSQFLYAYDRMQCYCEQFREIAECETIPTYIITIHTSEKNKIDSIEVKEKDKY